jgi:hypothetical protein
VRVLSAIIELTLSVGWYASHHTWEEALAQDMSKAYDIPIIFSQPTTSIAVLKSETCKKKGIHGFKNKA